MFASEAAKGDGGRPDRRRPLKLINTRDLGRSRNAGKIL